MINALKKFLFNNLNDSNRAAWIAAKLKETPKGYRILDAGAGELRYKPYCAHLDYISQDFCQYDVKGDGTGLTQEKWDTSRIDIVCDITSIPLPNSSFDSILCTEVLEHVPEPTKALDEFDRLLKPNGRLILTAPFASWVHMAPYHFSSGFSRFWYVHHLEKRGFRIEELTPNGDWFAFFQQDLMSLGSFARKYGDWSWPLAYVLAIFGALYFKIRGGKPADDIACFSWLCVAVKI